MSRRDELLRRAEERARDLERAICAAFADDIVRATVTLGTVSSVDPESGREVHAYAYGINLYVSTLARPDVSVSVGVDAQNVVVAAKIESALSRLPSKNRRR